MLSYSEWYMMCVITQTTITISHINFHVLNIITFDSHITSVSLTEKYSTCKLKMHVNFQRYITKQKIDDLYSVHPVVVIFKLFHYD